MHDLLAFLSLCPILIVGLGSLIPQQSVLSALERSGWVVSLPHSYRDKLSNAMPSLSQGLTHEFNHGYDQRKNITALWGNLEV